MAVRSALILSFALLLPSAAPSQEREAVRIQAGSSHQRQVVALGRDLLVEGEARAGVAAIGGSVVVSGRVAGDVIVLGGDARLAEGAVVDGDVHVLGGELDAAPGASVGGRSVAYPGAPSTWLVLLEGPALGLSPWSPVVLAAKLALLVAWMVTTLLLLATAGPQLQRTARSVRREPFRDVFVGLVAVLTMVLTLLFLSAFAAVVVGVPLLLLVVLFALVLKLWGSVAVFLAVGQMVLEASGRRRELALTAATLGLILFGLIKLIPYVGTWIWTLVTLTGVGAALNTKLGREEPWFEAVAAER